jgi:hypothetical protein
VKDMVFFEMLRRLETTISKIKESTGFVKNVFVQEKVTPAKKNVFK